MSLFTLCGIKFGWSSVIGLVPAIGDILDAFMAMMVFRTCQQVEGGLPADVKAKMMFNIIVDFFIGIVPFIGDVADAVFKANTKNAAELEKYLRKKGAQNLRASNIPQPLVDPSDPDEYDRMMSSDSPPEYNSTEPGRNEPMRPDPVRQAGPRRDAAAQQPVGAQQSGVTQTTNTTTHTETGFIGRLFGRNKQPDLETGAAGRTATPMTGTGSQAVGSRRVDEPLPPVPSQAQAGRTPKVQKTRR